MEGTVYVGRGMAVAPTLPSILLAEDNDDLREAMKAVLTFKGYGVVACPDGLAALEAFHSARPFQLLITDIEMPRKSGVDLARELTTLCSSLPVIVVSGNVIPISLAEDMQERKWSFLPKPYALPQLLGEVERLLHLRHAHAPALAVVGTKPLKEGGLKVDFTDGTCAFLTVAQLIEAASPRQLQSAAWPDGVQMEYCCYEGCAFCS